MNETSSALQMILDKIETMDSNIKDRFDAQEKYLNMRLDHIEMMANKAHARLDTQKETVTEICDWKHQMKSPEDIDELFKWKNQITGALWVVPFVLTPLTALITTWLLNFFKILGA